MNAQVSVKSKVAWSTCHGLSRPQEILKSMGLVIIGNCNSILTANKTWYFIHYFST